MGRPREFDEDEVIADAVQAFWKQGYGATSIPDLIAATALERGSLYKAFGDKHSLFERAFDEYLRSGRSAMAQTLDSADPPLQRLRNWLRGVSQGCSGAAGGPGCLAVNAMVELAPSDEAVRERLTRHWALIERALERTLSEGQDTGEIRNDLQPRELARLIARLIAGIAVFARQGSRIGVSETILALVANPR